ncbi:MAG: radical SAM protein [Nitrospina sp.]|nr:radical SAM protein [Nitrospina sp.]MBT6601198.1 radical SAM protein [Nitrospina sp.]
MKNKKKFSLVLVKPSHYDDDGYVIQWFRSSMPANSLACLYGLAVECDKEKVLGENVEIEIHAFDEANTHINTKKITSIIESADDGMLMLVGVQTNQFPRSLDIAEPLRAKGIKVVVGGFHVSGVMSMLKEPDNFIQKALDIGVSIFSGEAEGRLGQVLIDAASDKLDPIYNFLDDLPDIDNVAMPLLPTERIRLTAGSTTSFDAGRGCPFTCSFCTIINVQGHKSRDRSIESIENIIRENVKQGLSSFFISDDDFARNKNWEGILDKFIELREVHKLKISFTIQVDTLCYNLPGFIEKSGRAGVKRAFIGLENINPDSLLGASKRQNKITDYRAMLLAWKKVGVITCCGYILGFPNDTQESILRDIEIIKRELPVDLLEFFYLTPFPGSEDHKKLHAIGTEMDKDLNMYDANHPVTAHPKMSKENWEDACHKAWENYYTYEHAEILIKRAIATGTSSSKTMGLITWFKGCIHIENVHPLEGGFFRRKSRKERRHTFPIEPPFIFYPKYFSEIIWKHFCWVLLVIRMRLICKQVRNDPKNSEYMDLALEPLIENETETLELFQSESAKKFVTKQERFKKMQHGETLAT